jgi:methyl-accepting chemotaxis protein
MEAASTFARPLGNRRGTGEPPHPTFVRWLFLWITTLVLVVIVVIGFLIGIVSNLKNINRGLHSATASVTAIKGNANPLPGYIGVINKNLTSINAALLPIPTQGRDILASLNSIHGSLGQVQGSLVDTSDSLVNTSGSLVNTSNSLVSTAGMLGTISSALVGVSHTLGGVEGSLADTSNMLGTISSSLKNVTSTAITIRDRAGSISTVLIKAQGTTDGTALINTQLQTLLNAPTGLNAVLGDAGNILTGLQYANGHLNSICKATVLNTAVVSLTGLTNASGPCPAQ